MRDEDHMRHALALGRRTMGATGQNPAVGCVIVKDAQIVGVGWTQEGGAPHAEAAALKMAGDLAVGSTVYVSLEPCSHHGRTAPCAHALIAAGVARVVTAVQDPDPRVSGRGHSALREAGIEVETGLLQRQAVRDLAGFFSRILKGRPHVTLKLAMSADGMIAAAPGQRTAITGEQASARTHLMRAQSDAIMVGVRTVITDDPALTCRLPGLEHRSPVRVIVDGSLRTPINSKLVASARQHPLIVLIGELAEGCDQFEARGVQLIRCRKIEESRIDLAFGLRQLGRLGINRLMVEGGAVLARQLLEEKLVDEIKIIRSAKMLGSQGVRANLDLAGFHPTGEETLGQDVLSSYERAGESS